jgi:hypothetical protein
MDRSVELGGKAAPDGGPVRDDGLADDRDSEGTVLADIDSEDIESEDIESELYTSTREAGVGAIGAGPVADG